jgi:CTP:molybdopterin cytidylyltransferase MocA
MGSVRALDGRYTRTMTVAAVILSATAEGALADTLGQPRVRRLADLAWSGGALPIIVLSPDPDGAVAAALAGSEAVYGSPAAPEAGPVGQMVRGTELALAEVHDTTAVLLWPARLTWVGPETITSLIEAHGTDSATILRPAWHGDPGWPVLVPTVHLEALRSVPPDQMPPQVIEDLVGAIGSRVVEVGDPGVVHDVDTAVADLPTYEGPPDPPAGHTHEWGADVAAEAGLAEP